MEWFEVTYTSMYLLAGGVGLIIVCMLWISFDTFSHGAAQHKHMFLRRRYWLYYALVFFSGACSSGTDAFLTFTTISVFDKTTFQKKIMK
jgi:hypothetical protein